MSTSILCLKTLNSPVELVTCGSELCFKFYCSWLKVKHKHFVPGVRVPAVLGDFWYPKVFNKGTLDKEKKPSFSYALHFYRIFQHRSNKIWHIQVHCLMDGTYLFASFPTIPHSQVWRDLDSCITDASNEARDNVKYLYTLEELCKPLYSNDPSAIIECLPSVMNAIHMIHAVSRYYHSSERMTSLFVKVRAYWYMGLISTCIHHYF